VAEEKMQTYFYDVTLRDGNHALRHNLTSDFVRDYCKLADQSDVWAVEVGHGNGLGASSFLVGKSAVDDEALLTAARENLKNSKLAVHAIPGFATIKRDIRPAIELGVEVFRIATHVTEASVAQKHVEFIAERGLVVHGVLMMSHMTDVEGIVEQASLMSSYGASAVILMDSAGHFIPIEVAERVRAIRDSLDLHVGFHAHNNLGVAVSNALTAVDSGAAIIDGSSMGLGAGSGNAQLENIIATYGRSHLSREKIREHLLMSRLVENTYDQFLPRTNSSSIESGMAGVFSGYAPQVKKLADELGIEPAVLWNEIGRRRLVAGQESMIREVALDLMNL
jgi:4-hydroxy 2-oxovalerate aldolase